MIPGGGEEVIGLRARWRLRGDVRGSEREGELQ